MRLLVITADKERAEDVFEELGELGGVIVYREIKRTEWIEKAGTETDMLTDDIDAVLIHTEDGESLSEEVQRIREIWWKPLLVCSERSAYYQELQCFRAGADDYQSTGCPAALLYIRLWRLHQLYGNREGSVPESGGLIENPRERQFYWEDVSLKLTEKEYQVLFWLVHSREDVVPKEKILYEIWGRDDNSACRALDTMMKQLRRKLSGTGLAVKTYYGKGYRVERDV